MSKVFSVGTGKVGSKPKFGICLTTLKNSVIIYENVYNKMCKKWEVKIKGGNVVFYSHSSKFLCDNWISENKTIKE